MQSAGIAEQSGVIKKNVLTNGCNQLAYLNATLNKKPPSIDFLGIANGLPWVYFEKHIKLWNKLIVTVKKTKQNYGINSL